MEKERDIWQKWKRRLKTPFNGASASRSRGVSWGFSDAPRCYAGFPLATRPTYQRKASALPNQPEHHHTNRLRRLPHRVFSRRIRAGSSLCPVLHFSQSDPPPDPTVAGSAPGPCPPSAQGFISLSSNHLAPGFSAPPTKYKYPKGLSLR